MSQKAARPSSYQQVGSGCCVRINHLQGSERTIEKLVERPRQICPREDDGAHLTGLTGRVCGFSANQCKNQQVGSARERSADLTETSSEGRDLQSSSSLASSLPHPAARRGRGRPPRQSWKSPPLPPPSASLPEDCNNLRLASPPAALLGCSLFKIPQRLLRS